MSEPERTPEATFAETVASCCPSDGAQDVLELGCSRGDFTPALAEEFTGQVYGVDQDPYLISIANEKYTHARVIYSEGHAEKIPLPPGSCDVVVMRNLVWHISEVMSQVADEIARVLRPGGHLVIHSCFSDRPFTPTMRCHSPQDARVDMFPSTEQVVAPFRRVGLDVSAELVMDTGHLLVLA